MLSGSHDFGNGFGINASVGYQGGLKNGACVTEIGGQLSCSITDYKLGGTYTIDGWVLGLAYVVDQPRPDFGAPRPTGPQHQQRHRAVVGHQEFLTSRTAKES